MNSCAARLLHNIVVAAFFTAGCALFFQPARACADEQGWQPIAADLELLQLSVNSYGFFPNSIVLLRSSLKNFQVGVIRAEEFGRAHDSAMHLVQNARAAAGINANFFDDQGAPLGLVISRGITHRKLHKGGRTLTGVFTITSAGPSITNRASFDPRSAIEAVQAGPRLLEHGSAIRGLSDSASHSNRAGVCLDNQGRIVLYIVTSNFFGVSLDRLIDVLRDAPIGCMEALNLDGGGSAQFYLNPLSMRDATLPELSIEGHDDVPVVLAFFPRAAG